MNTGFLGPAVATVLTVYGIETFRSDINDLRLPELQQYLPFTVLKLSTSRRSVLSSILVATVLTVYGIETQLPRMHYLI